MVEKISWKLHFSFFIVDLLRSFQIAHIATHKTALQAWRAAAGAKRRIYPEKIFWQSEMTGRSRPHQSPTALQICWANEHLNNAWSTFSTAAEHKGQEIEGNAVPRLASSRHVSSKHLLARQMNRFILAINYTRQWANQKTRSKYYQELWRLVEPDTEEQAQNQVSSLLEKAEDSCRRCNIAINSEDSRPRRAWRHSQLNWRPWSEVLTRSWMRQSWFKSSVDRRLNLLESRELPTHMFRQNSVDSPAPTNNSL